ncbi:hypothetical protein PtA15_7A214 [Puccinia triticina]|uniref:Uncharacterized protein n=1 Tax=Puccinia triticina TaxID=208348 RepID=A0ABY7CQ72_9BASI|nr:uncharacterized protein PtA15_7A214 [Puccinia triticina]WAQ86488.1 hypothetical protein PtA15_7A214 [Puccinia triticina]
MTFSSAMLYIPAVLQQQAGLTHPSGPCLVFRSNRFSHLLDYESRFKWLRSSQSRKSTDDVMILKSLITEASS